MSRQAGLEQTPRTQGKPRRPSALGLAAAVALLPACILLGSLLLPGPRPAGEEALQDLERTLVQPTDPEEILRRCDIVRSEVAGTAQAHRLKAIEECAKRLREEQERDRRLTALLDEVRHVWQTDPTYYHRNSILVALGAALEIAGDRRDQVERLKTEYERALQERTRLEQSRQATFGDRAGH